MVVCGGKRAVLVFPSAGDLGKHIFCLSRNSTEVYENVPTLQDLQNQTSKYINIENNTTILGKGICVN